MSNRVYISAFIFLFVCGYSILFARGKKYEKEKCFWIQDFFFIQIPAPGGGAKRRRQAAAPNSSGAKRRRRQVAAAPPGGGGAKRGANDFDEVVAFYGDGQPRVGRLCTAQGKFRPGREAAHGGQCATVAVRAFADDANAEDDHDGDRDESVNDNALLLASYVVIAFGNATRQRTPRVGPLPWA